MSFPYPPETMTRAGGRTTFAAIRTHRARQSFSSPFSFLFFFRPHQAHAQAGQAGCHRARVCRRCRTPNGTSSARSYRHAPYSTPRPKRRGGVRESGGGLTNARQVGNAVRRATRRAGPAGARRAAARGVGGCRAECEARSVRGTSSSDRSC